MSRSSSVKNQSGFSLIAAIFVMVIMAMFGILIARYVAISSTSSSEDYLSAQALYAAESTAQLRILCDDGGGSFTDCTTINPTIRNTTTNGTSSTNGTLTTLRVSAQRNNIYREIEVKYQL